jgi:hypothetical protein
MDNLDSHCAELKLRPPKENQEAPQQGGATKEKPRPKPGRTSLRKQFYRFGNRFVKTKMSDPPVGGWRGGGVSDFGHEMKMETQTSLL